MPTTRPIPKRCEAIVRKIRERVRRPQLLPKSRSASTGQYLRWVKKGYEYCPMGLVPESLSSMPNCADDFSHGEHTTVIVRAFGAWWDEQTDPRAAVAAIWGSHPRKNTEGRK